MASDGATTFIEVGPGKVLSRLIRQTVPSLRVAQVGDPRSLEAAEALLAGS
jgi:malonyl CoA-acyl carrier protein transacylase